MGFNSNTETGQLIIIISIIIIIISFYLGRFVLRHIGPHFNPLEFHLPCTYTLPQNSF